MRRTDRRAHLFGHATSFLRDSPRFSPPSVIDRRREYPRNMPDLPLPATLAQATVLDREGDIYQRLLKNRIIFLGTQVEDQSANLICAQLLLLQAYDPETVIAL